MNSILKKCGVFLLLVSAGCAIDRTPHGFSGEVVGATADLAIVDAESDQGLLECWPSISPMSGTGKVVRYRLYFHLNKLTEHADLYRIERGWADAALPNDLNIGSLPATLRIRQTSYGAWTTNPVPPADLRRQEPLDFHVHDAEKIDGQWFVLTENNPIYGDWTVMGPKGAVATASKTAFQTGTARGPDYYAWDVAGASVIFTRGVPGSDEVDIWRYNDPPPNVKRYVLNSASYFAWRGDRYVPRDQYRSLYKSDLLSVLKD